LEDIEVAFEEGETEPKETILKQDRDKLSIAAYNVENFSANTSETSEEKAANIARAIVQDMHAPDIVGLIEMQDNNGMDSGPEDADASETFTRLIQVIEEAGGPTYDYVILTLYTMKMVERQIVIFVLDLYIIKTAYL